MTAAAHGRYPRLSQWLEGTVAVPPELDRPLYGLASDSRELAPGYAFLALPGARSHGLDYIDAVVDAGACAVLWPADEARTPQALAACRRRDVAAVAVPELKRHLGRLVSAFYADPSRALRVIGVTGTDGKTSVVQMLAAALERGGRGAGSLGTLGWGRGRDWHPATHTTPDLVQLHAGLARLRELGCDFVAMEVSSHGLDQGRVDGVDFELAVLTNLGRDHLDYHGSLDAYAKAKRRLFEWPGLAAVVLNLDDAFGRLLDAELDRRVERWTYGSAADARVRLVGLECLPQGLELRLATPAGEQSLRSGLIGRFNAENLLAGLASLLALGLPAEHALAGLQAVGPVAGRMETFRAPGRPALIVDYAHTPQALQAALGAAREHFSGRLLCVFGCGGDRDRGKRPLMGAAAEALADQVIITDDNPRSEAPAAIAAEILAGLRAPQNAEIIHDRAEAIQRAVALARPQDAILIAGKGHETTQTRGARQHHFSDREMAARLLEGHAHV